MGADLYIESISAPARKAGEVAFHAAVKKRDQAKSEKTKAKWQRAVDAAWDAMYPDAGYFRDSYNVTSVLKCYGLSWWRDVIPMLDPEGYLKPDSARTLLAILERKQLMLPTREELKADNAAVEESGDNSVEGWHGYYRDKAEQLKAFLRRGIELGEPIACSL